MKRNRLLTHIAGAGLLGATPVLAHTGQDGAWGHHGMMWGGGGAWFMGPIMMLLLLAMLVALVVLVVRWLGGTGASTVGTSNRKDASAMQILEERFARGEIDEEEFRQRKKALEE